MQPPQKGDACGVSKRRLCIATRNTAHMTSDQTKSAGWFGFLKNNLQLRKSEGAETQHPPLMPVLNVKVQAAWCDCLLHACLRWLRSCTGRAGGVKAPHIYASHQSGCITSLVASPSSAHVARVPSLKCKPCQATSKLPAEECSDACLTWGQLKF